jgi:hypothetical protein
MFAKIFWERCAEFVVEDEDAFFIEASAEETIAKILPLLSQHEKLKFEQMKDIYVAKATTGIVHEGCFYFLISRDAVSIKFESVAFMTSDLSSRGGKTKRLPDIPLGKIEDLGSIDPAAY